MTRNAVFFLLAMAAPAFAEESQLRNCNGRWTNLPCEEAKAGDTIKATRKVLSPTEAKLRSDKQGLFHELTMKNIDAKRKLQVDISIVSAEQLCFDRPSTLDECRAEIERLEDRLDRRVDAATDLREKELAKKEKELEKERKKAEAAAQSTVIVREVIPVYRRDGYSGYGGYPGYGYQYPGSNRQGGYAGWSGGRRHPYGSENTINPRIRVENNSGNIIVQNRPTIVTPPPPAPQSSGAAIIGVR